VQIDRRWLTFRSIEIAPAMTDAAPSNPMRVLHVISSMAASRGGPIISLSGLALTQAKIGMKVDIVATSSEADSAQEATRLRAAGVHVHLIWPTYGPFVWSPRIAPEVKRLVAHADVVHIHGLWEEVQHRAAVAAWNARIPFIISPTGMLSTWSLSQSRLKKQIYLAWRLKRHLHRASFLHFATGLERDTLADLDLATPAIVEPKGVNQEDFDAPPTPGAFRAQHPMLSGKKIVAFLGRIHPGKGVEHLIPALAMLPKDVVLVVIGPDSEGFRATMEALAATHSVTDRVLFIGALAGAAKVAALRDADVFALPSDHENFGIAVIEGLAAGLPLVLSEEVGVASMLVPSGVVSVVPRETSRIAHALQHWLRTDRPREEIARAATHYAREHFDWTRIARRWLDHYRAAIAAVRRT
jgi:glycosyltransferase involved in cell wall biosynthesis